MSDIAYWNFQINHLFRSSVMSSVQVFCCIYMLILKINVNVKANRVDLDQTASVQAARSGSPMFNQMVRVYSV